MECNLQFGVEEDIWQIYGRHTHGTFILVAIVLC